MIDVYETRLRRARGGSWTLAKYWALFRIRVVSGFAYLGEMILRTLFLAIILFILAQLWRTTYSGAGAHRIAGFTLTQMIWYLVMTEAISISRPQVNVEIDEEVRSGGIAYALGRPYHYVLYRLADHLGERVPRIAINLVLGSLVALAVVGPIHFTAIGLVSAGLAMLFAVLLDFAGVLCIGLQAFWIEDTRSAALIYSRATMILGGLLMPPAVFPKPLARWCQILPFTSVYYLPGRLLAGGASAGWEWSIVKQFLWFAGAFLLAMAIFRKGVMRIESNGG